MRSVRLLLAIALSVSAASIAAQDIRKSLESMVPKAAHPKPPPAPPPAKRVTVKCLAVYHRMIQEIDPAVSTSLPAGITATNPPTGHSYWDFYSSDFSASAVSCQYKNRSTPPTYERLYGFNCKNGARKADDTWECEI